MVLLPVYKSRLWRAVVADLVLDRSFFAVLLHFFFTARKSVVVVVPAAPSLQRDVWSVYFMTCGPRYFDPLPRRRRCFIRLVYRGHSPPNGAKATALIRGNFLSQPWHMEIQTRPLLFYSFPASPASFALCIRLYHRCPSRGSVVMTSQSPSLRIPL